MIGNIWLKEIQAELYTWKSLVWLLLSALLFSLTSYLMLTNKELSLLDQTELMWLLGKIIISSALLVVAIDASSVVNIEFEKETAESLFLAPVSITDFVLGKLLSSLTLWLMVFLVAIPYILVASSGSNLTLYFILYAFFLGTLGAGGFAALILAISLLFRSSKNTLTTSLIILLALSIPALFSSTFKNNAVAGFIGSINPVENIFSSLDNVLVDYQTSLVQNVKFLLPLLVFCALGFLLLFLSMKKFMRDGVIKNE
jgi:ABC-type transport system involved in multi-copper enzyme maturation permease subunit